MTKRLTLSIYFFATFLQSGAYGLTFLLPLLFHDFGANEKDVGNVLAVTAISALITIYFLGYFITKWGYMNSIGISSIFIAISLFIFAEITNTGFLSYFAGILLGIGWGVFYVLTPIVLTEITDKQQRVQIFTLLSVFIMAGFGLSPVFGDLLVKSNYNVSHVFTLSCVFSLMSGILFFALKKSVASLSSRKTIEHSHKMLTLSKLKKVMRSSAARPIIMVGLGASVFAAITNFQTIYAQENGLDYSLYFLFYTITVIICRVLFARFSGGKSPYGVIASLLAIMAMSVFLFIFIDGNALLYIFGAILFGVGYGVSYPIVKAMASQDAEPHLFDETMQIFGFSYFIGVFGFPFIAGWIIVTQNILILLFLAFALSVIECFLALRRHLERINL